jgi:protein SCO1
VRKVSRLLSLISVLAGSVLITGSAIAQTGSSHETNKMDMRSTESSSSPTPLVSSKSPNQMGHDGAMTLKNFDRKEALKISKRALGRKLADYEFTTADGQAFRLSELSGKPYLVNFIYTSCMQTCPMIVENLERSVKVARDALGDDSFKVITIGFDTKNDTPTRMKSYSGAHRVGNDNWILLSASEETILSITDALGFYFVKAPHGFDHLAQTTVVDEVGIVYRQIYGVALKAPTVVEPLKQLVFGRKTGYTSFSGLKNQVKLFCTIYDPNTGHYKFDFSFIISIVIGLAILSSFAVIFVRTWISMKKRENSV